MRILITGGAGCLGSNLIEHWLPQGNEILVIDNFATGKREVVPPVAGLSVIEGTIADRGLVERAFSKFRPTHVIHAAASYKDPNDWPSDVATNVTGTVNVIQAARAANVCRAGLFADGAVLRQANPHTHPDRSSAAAIHQLCDLQDRG